MTIDVLLEVAQKQGMFVALVLFVIWEARSREAKFAQRESEYMAETKERENRYITQNEKNQELIQTLAGTLSEVNDMKEDVAYLRNRYEQQDAIAQYANQQRGGMAP